MISSSSTIQSSSSSRFASAILPRHTRLPHKRQRLALPSFIFAAALLISAPVLLRNGVRNQHDIVLRTHAHTPLSDIDSQSFAEALSTVRKRSATRTFNFTSSPPPQVVIVTAINGAFCRYLLNLSCSLLRAGGAALLNALLVVPLDNSAAGCASRHGFVSAYDKSFQQKSTAEAQRFGTPGFNALSKRKIHAVRRVLELGSDVLFTDADIFWCTNALLELQHKMQNEYAHYDLAFQTAWPRALINSGFYYARASKRTRMLFHELERTGESAAQNDQVVFNRVLCAHSAGGVVLPPLEEHSDDRNGNEHAKNRPSGCVAGSGARAVLLAPSRFPTGGEIVDAQRIFHRKRNDVVRLCEGGLVAVLHNNCILEEKKLARFIVKGLWYVKDTHDENVLGNGNANSMHYCTKFAAPATKQAIRKCGWPKCGKLDVPQLENAHDTLGHAVQRPHRSVNEQPQDARSE